MKGPPKATEIGPRALTLAWDEPEHAEPVTGYLVQRLAESKVSFACLQQRRFSTPFQRCSAPTCPSSVSLILFFLFQKKNTYETLGRTDGRQFLVEVKETTACDKSASSV
jgi:hypothetical protein